MTNLTTALQTESAAERWRAIENLNHPATQQMDAHTLSALTQALSDTHPFVRWQAGLALAKQSEGRQKLLETLNDASTAGSPKNIPMYSTIVDALGRNPLSPNAGLPLINALHSHDSRLRQSAAEALAKQSSAEAVPHLIDAMKDDDPLVRRAAAYALGQVDDSKARQALIDGLQDKAVIVRRSAAYALGALQAEAAISHLKISLTDKDAATRRNAAWSLGRIGSPETVPDLENLLNDEALDGEVQAAAAAAIKAITKPRWLQRLLELRGRFR